MKQLLLFVAFTISGLHLFATIRTVSNLPSTLAQFNTIQAAVNAASNTDTIYVHGSPNAYAAFTITDKQLVVIGPGWSPNKNLPLTAVVQGIVLTGSSTSGTEIQGLVITSTVSANTSHPNNIRFIRNYLTQSLSFQLLEGGTYTGYLFEGNVFDNSFIHATGGATYQNFLFQNNYFFESGCCVGGNFNGFTNTVNVLINHNLFFGPASGTRDVFVTNCRFLTITNNVFVKRNAASNNSSSTFNNNITFNAGTNNPWDVNGNTNAGGNVANADPQMVSQNDVNSGVNNALNDYTIAAGPANNSGSDGKDMGLLYDAVGSLNWVNSRASRLPFLFSMNIVNPTIPVGGTLNVNVEARKNN